MAALSPVYRRSPPTIPFPGNSWPNGNQISPSFAGSNPSSVERVLKQWPTSILPARGGKEIDARFRSTSTVILLKRSDSTDFSMRLQRTHFGRNGDP